MTQCWSTHCADTTPHDSLHTAGDGQRWSQTPEQEFNPRVGEYVDTAALGTRVTAQLQHRVTETGEWFPCGPMEIPHPLDTLPISTLNEFCTDEELAPRSEGFYRLLVNDVVEAEGHLRYEVRRDVIFTTPDEDADLAAASAADAAYEAELERIAAEGGAALPAA